MSQPDATIQEATRLLEAGAEADALKVLARLVVETEDPTLWHEIHDLAEKAHESSHGFRKIEWDRLVIETEAGP